MADPKISEVRSHKTVEKKSNQSSEQNKEVEEVTADKNNTTKTGVLQSHHRDLPLANPNQSRSQQNYKPYIYIYILL